MRMTAPILTAALLTFCVGCTTGPFAILSEDQPTGLEPGSNEWWAHQASLPAGARQRCYKGKNWPVQPRPTGPKQQLTQAFHSAHYWPLPYICQDRAIVKQMVSLQETNGWTEESTLFTRHFKPDNTLSVPGELHLIDILEDNPLKYRTVYIQSTYNETIDAARMANVQSVIQEVTQGQEEVPVVVRRARDYSRPANEVNIINDLYTGSIPTPRLGRGGGSGTSTGLPVTGP